MRNFFTLLFLTAFLPLGANAQGLAGQTLGGCPERIYIGADGAAVAAAYSLASASNRDDILIGRGDSAVQVGTKDCSDSLAYVYCTDGLLFGILSPEGALIGGAAGLAVGAKKRKPSLLGGLIGSGAVGLGKGVFDVSQCRKKQADLESTANTILAGMTFNLRGSATPQGALNAIRQQASSLARNKAITAEDAQAFMTVVDSVTNQLSQ